MLKITVMNDKIHVAHCWLSKGGKNVCENEKITNFPLVKPAKDFQQLSVEVLVRGGFFLLKSCSPIQPILQY